jgi:hypothetical protein
MLMPGMICTVAVRMNPQTAGPKAASLTMSALQGGTLTAMLAGVGWTPAKLTMTPATGAFGSSPLMTPSAPIDFTVTNTGDQPTGPIGPMFTGGADFMLSQNQCPPTLPGLQSCHMFVRFMPTAIGARTGTFTINATPGGSASASLSGTGASPLTISPSTFNFGSAPIGVGGVITTFTVTNASTLGSIPLTTVAAPAAFRITTNGCAGRTLGPSMSCTMYVQLFPTAAGPVSGSLTVNGATGWTAAATLSGSGT